MYFSTTETSTPLYPSPPNRGREGVVPDEQKRERVELPCSEPICMDDRARLLLLLVSKAIPARFVNHENFRTGGG